MALGVELGDVRHEHGWNKAAHPSTEGHQCASLQAAAARLARRWVARPTASRAAPSGTPATAPVTSPASTGRSTAMGVAIAPAAIPIQAATHAAVTAAALVLRGLMVRDFRDYLEGDREDRVYWITADLERTYAKLGGWSPEALEEDALWALMLGFEVRVVDADGKLVADTERSIASLSPGMRRRGLAAQHARRSASAQYHPYPLFLAGSRIGVLEVRPLELGKGAVFVERSNRFLLGTVVVMGAIALALSAFAARRLTRPLKELCRRPRPSAKAISPGGSGSLRRTRSGRSPRSSTAWLRRSTAWSSSGRSCSRTWPTSCERLSPRCGPSWRG